jgi:hydrogenase maturation protease
MGGASHRWLAGRAAPRRRRAKPQILVLGVGNALLGDGGIGGAAIARLERERLPARVELRDAGTSMIDVVAGLGRYERVIVIDAVKVLGRTRGSVVEFELSCGAAGDALATVSTHEFELGGLRALAAALAIELPAVHVVGFVPVSIELGSGLTPAAAAALDDIVARVLRLVLEARRRPAGAALAPGMAG